MHEQHLKKLRLRKLNIDLLKMPSCVFHLIKIVINISKNRYIIISIKRTMTIIMCIILQSKFFRFFYNLYNLFNMVPT